MNYSDYKVATGRTMPASGMLEVLNQGIDVHWTSENTSGQVDLELMSNPVAIASTSSSCIYRACDKVSIGLGLDKLRRIGELLKLFILYECPDIVSANNCKQVASMQQLPKNCLYIRDFGCAVHRVHRCIVAATDEDKLCGDVHSVCWIAGMPR